MSKELIQPRASWKDVKHHYLNAINDPWYKVVCDLDNLVSKFSYEFYFGKGMKTLHLPITTGTISSPMGLGSDSLPVQISLFDIQTYLADSMQFMLEYGCRFYNEGCFYIMPSFRGEKADERHLCQFYHSEAEIIGGLEDAITLVEDYIRYITERITEEFGKTIETVTGDTRHIDALLRKNRFDRISFSNAIGILETKNGGKGYSDINGIKSLSKEGEQFLVEYFDGIVWVTNHEHMSLPFYQAYSDDEKYAQNADLLFGIGEVVGLGERHTSFKDVEKSLKQHGVKKETYEWYCEMKKQYPLHTSGFGMGIERFILWILRHNDIRDCQLIPRFNGENILP